MAKKEKKFHTLLRWVSSIKRTIEDAGWIVYRTAESRRTLSVYLLARREKTRDTINVRISDHAKKKIWVYQGAVKLQEVPDLDFRAEDGVVCDMADLRKLLVMPSDLIRRRKHNLELAAMMNQYCESRNTFDGTTCK